jgi:hypothetical protein
LDDIEHPPEPSNLRFLRRLVTVLTVVMICGFLVLIFTLVIRLRAPAPVPAPTVLTLPAEIALPDGTIPLAYTRGPDWYAITTPEALLIYNTDGTLRQSVPIR